MKLNEINKHDGVRTSRKRVGRGIGSGLGKTSGRGHKGQKARSGGGVRPGFEGGQTPLFRRIVKRGFNNKRFMTEYTIINVSTLDKLKVGTIVTPTLLKELGLVKKTKTRIKILGQGELTKRLTVKAHHFSAVAQKKIEAVGGKIEVI